MNDHSFRRAVRLWTYGLMFTIMLAFTGLALADKPPQALFDRVTSTSQLVHKGTCDVPFLNKVGVDCLIYHDGQNDLLWVVLFDGKGGAPSVTHVFMSKGDQEKVVWCRQDVCL